MGYGNRERAWTYKEYVEKYEQLQAENKKYKDALEEIAAIRVMACDNTPNGDYACDLHIEIAVQALKGEKNGEQNTIPPTVGGENDV